MKINMFVADCVIRYRAATATTAIIIPLPSPLDGQPNSKADNNPMMNFAVLLYIMYLLNLSDIDLHPVQVYDW